MFSFLTAPFSAGTPPPAARRDRPTPIPAGLILALLALGCMRGSAAAAQEPYAALVIDSGTGAVLHAHEATHPWYPASLTKLLTVYMTLAAVDAGRLALEDSLTVSSEAAAQPPVALGLTEGERITVDEALQAVLTRSANDAAVVLAEAVAGSERAFAARMNVQARALGMRESHFRNASGLPDARQVSTARDLARLLQALLQHFPEDYARLGARSFEWGGRRLPAFNGLLERYEGADGLKTGFTCGSGYNLAVSAQREGRRLIAVVLGAPGPQARARLMSRVLDQGFAERSAGQGIAELRPTAGPPPFRLGPERCLLSTPAAPRVARRRPDWALLLGVLGEAEAADKLARQALQASRALRSGGRAAVRRRESHDTPIWQALLVDLERDEALRTCRGLRRLGAWCRVRPPGTP